MDDFRTPEPKRRYEMPFLLLCGLGFSVFAAALGAVVLTGIVASSLFAGVHYEVNGQAVTRAEFYIRTWPLYVIAPVAFAIVGRIAYLLWREDPRSRQLIIGFWGLCLCAAIGLAIAERTSEAWIGVAPVALVVILAWLYLYRKATVVAYYAVLASHHAA